jgi:HK97 gp10 family phage protein
MGVSISVDASDAIAMLQRGAANLPQAIQQAFEKGGSQMQAMAQSLVHSVSGELAASITYSASETELVFGTSLFYAHWVEFGRGPVRPIHAKALHWGNVFVRYAGPAPPHPFIRPAFAAVFPEMVSEMADSIAQGFE